MFFSWYRYARACSAWRRTLLTSFKKIFLSLNKLSKGRYSITRTGPPPSSIKSTQLIIYSYEYISNSLSVFISGSIYVYNILGYCDFQISFGVLSRLSCHKLLSSKQLACTRVVGFANYSEFAFADLIMQEIGISAAYSALHKWRDLRRRLNIQRLYIWYSFPIFRIKGLLVPIILALMLVIGGERDFEYKSANSDLGLL